MDLFYADSANHNLKTNQCLGCLDRDMCYVRKLATAKVADTIIAHSRPFVLRPSAIFLAGVFPPRLQTSRYAGLLLIDNINVQQRTLPALSAMNIVNVVERLHQRTVGVTVAAAANYCRLTTSSTALENNATVLANNLHHGHSLKNAPTCTLAVKTPSASRSRLPPSLRHRNNTTHGKLRSWQRRMLR